MKYHVTYQNPHAFDAAPNIFLVQRWVNTTLLNLVEQAELTIRLVDINTICALNKQYRQKNKPTNVLSFPSEIPPELKEQIGIHELGDIIICHEVIEKEAKTQHKILEDHYAHMIIHGVLHLLGYDHIKQIDADIMEPLEIKILDLLNISNPYELNDDIEYD